MMFQVGTPSTNNFLESSPRSLVGSLTAQDWSSSGPPALYMTLYNTPKLCVIVNLSLLIISSPP